MSKAKPNIIWHHDNRYRCMTIYSADENNMRTMTYIFRPHKGLTKWERYCCIKTEHMVKFCKIKMDKFNGKAPRGACISSTMESLKAAYAAGVEE